MINSLQDYMWSISTSKVAILFPIALCLVMYGSAVLGLRIAEHSQSHGNQHIKSGGTK